MKPPIEPGQIRTGLAAAGLSAGAAELESLAAYLCLLVAWGRVHNLTGRLEPAELIDRHLVESLSLAPLVKGTRVADIGSGAGLPGIPLAVAMRAKHFSLIESRAKKARFLRHVAACLPLANVEVHEGRAENFRSEPPFDTLLARAVAPPRKLLAMTRHLLGPGSRLVLLTSARLEAEWRALAAEESLQLLAGDSLPRLERSTAVVLERIR